jgi:hypothetical protein
MCRRCGRLRLQCSLHVGVWHGASINGNQWHACALLVAIDRQNLRAHVKVA